PNSSLSGVSSSRRGACQIFGLWSGPANCLPGLVVVAQTPGSARPFHRLVCPAAPGPDPPAGLQHAFFNTAFGKSSALGQPFVRPGGAPDLGRLAAALPAPDLFAGDLHRAGSLSRHLLSRGQLASSGLDHGTGQGRSHPPAQSLAQGTLGPTSGA